MSKYIAPEFKKTEFNCPFCEVYARQDWNSFLGKYRGGKSTNSFFDGASPYAYYCFCNHCKQHSIWVNEKMVFPDSTNVPMPNDDLSDEIKNDYNEAASIFEKSPRAAAALLRLIIEKLCIKFECQGKSLNDKIGYLVKEKGLNSRVTKAFDTIRILGNESVHPGHINLNDNREVAFKLFGLVNFIAEKMITEEKELDKIYGILPEGHKKAIDGRNKR